MDALLLPVGGDWYAVEMTSVREVMARPAVTPVPTGPFGLLGLFNLRGDILPLFDTAALLGRAPLPAQPFATVIATGAGAAGFSVSAMPEATELGDPIAGEVVVGMTTFAVGSRLVTLLDVEQLLASLGRGS